MKHGSPQRHREPEQQRGMGILPMRLPSARVTQGQDARAALLSILRNLLEADE